MRAYIVILAGALACKSSTSSVPAPQEAESSALKPGQVAATNEACESAIARMRKVMPESLDPDPEVDRADCKKLPAELVACLATINTRDDAEACVDRLTKPGP